MPRLFALLIGLCSLLACPPVQAQDADSAVIALRQQLARSRPDTNRVWLLSELCWALNRQDLPAARRYGEQGLALARRLGHRRGEAALLNDLGTVTVYQRDLKAATSYYQQATRVAATTGQRRVAGYAWMGLGNVASTQSRFADAARYLQQAERIFDQFPAAERGQPLTLVYLNFSNLYASAEQGRPTLSYGARAWRLARQLGNGEAAAMAARNLGNGHLYLQWLDSAQYWYRQALQLEEELDDQFALASEYNNLSKVAELRGQWPEALRLARRGLPLARQHDDKDTETELLTVLADALARTGRPDSAFQVMKRVVVLRERLARTEGDSALARLQVRFNVEQQQARLRSLTARARLNALAAEQARTRTYWLLGGLAGLVLLVLGLVALIRRLSRARAALAAATATQNKLYALIGHDLRSPITAFGGLLDLLPRYRRRGDMAQLEATEAELRQASSELRRLLDNLLLWAASQQGELQPRLEPVPAQELLQETVALYTSAAQARQVRLEVEPAANEITVQADRQMALAVLRNFVDNALKVSEAGAEIRLSAVTMDKQRVQLWVRDYGPGLQPETAPAPLRRSTGLGLRLSRLLAERQQGSLHLSPAAQGPGLVAALELPRVGNKV